MLQQISLLEVENKFFQIDGTAEEGGGQDVGLIVRVAGLNEVYSEGTKKRKWSGTGLRERQNIRQIVEFEFEMSDSPGMRGKRCNCAERSVAIGDYFQWGLFGAFKEGCHVLLSLRKEQLGP